MRGELIGASAEFAGGWLGPYRRRLRAVALVGQSSGAWVARHRACRNARVLVLGFPTRRNGALHPIQRWRTQIAVRTVEGAEDGLLVFSGAATRGRLTSEAAAMAGYAEQLHVPEARIRLEPRARNTWENLNLGLPMVAAQDAIAVVSDPIHAARSRKYLAMQRPDLVERLVLADDYRLLERWWLKVPVASRELFIVARDLLRYRRP